MPSGPCLAAALELTRTCQVSFHDAAYHALAIVESTRGSIVAPNRSR